MAVSYPDRYHSLCLSFFLSFLSFSLSSSSSSEWRPYYDSLCLHCTSLPSFFLSLQHQGRCDRCASQPTSHSLTRPDFVRFWCLGNRGAVVSMTETETETAPELERSIESNWRQRQQQQAHLLAAACQAFYCQKFSSWQFAAAAAA